jgi:uncharacterized LabA/DUF88 family protein
MPARAAVLIDGFNLYHSLQADKASKWLDPCKFIKDALIQHADTAEVVAIHYFTALPLHLSLTDPGRLARHRIYLRALSAQRNPRIEIHHGRIRAQSIEISQGRSKTRGRIWREKGTDIALAVKLFELAMTGAYDEFIIVSGDADYGPLAKGFARMYLGRRLIFAFPLLRVSNELLNLAPGSLILTQAHYRASRLPDEIILPSGKKLHCPKEWLR